MQSLEPGAILLGRYRIRKVVGRGAMGVVLAARDEELDNDVAIKVLVGMQDALSEPVERFMREARIAVKLKSDHVVRVMDAGTLETGTPFMVMELLDGSDLASAGPLPPMTAVDCVLQAIDAVAEAHTQGVIHRDLKPSNLFLAKRPGAPPIVKVLDFGISKARNLDGDPSLTTEESILGSPRYMPPEQFRSAKLVDERTDVWALGAILYTLLRGAPPFDGASIGEVFAAVLQEEPASLRAIPPELEAVVWRCLSKEPAQRYPNVAALAGALAPFGSGEWRRCVARAQTLLEDEPMSVPAGDPRPKPAHWPMVLGIAVALGSLLLLGASGTARMKPREAMNAVAPPVATPAPIESAESAAPPPARSATEAPPKRTPSRAPSAKVRKATVPAASAAPVEDVDAGVSLGTIFDDRH
ncbi:protein kinase [Pendulispora rubella]|uniref:Protein kinase n=1 Tax=Pendulispora rubella TaxID=2741070 RepID=A0ABZ2KZ54_9BACT